jgi:hypothetical protein
MVSFRVGSDDGAVLEKEFEPVFMSQQLINLNARQIGMKMSIAGKPTLPFMASTLPPIFANLGGNREIVVQNSRDSSTKTKKDVKEAISTWLGADFGEEEVKPAGSGGGFAGYQGNKPRDGGGYQGGGNSSGYQGNRDGQSGGYQGSRDGQNSGYQGNKDGASKPWQNRDNNQGGYQGNKPQGGYQNDKPNYGKPETGDDGQPREKKRKPNPFLQPTKDDRQKQEFDRFVSESQGLPVAPTARNIQNSSPQSKLDALKNLRKPGS